jgi:hypothetical protein
LGTNGVEKLAHLFLRDHLSGDRARDAARGEEIRRALNPVVTWPFL